MIVYEIYTNMKEDAKQEFNTYEEAKHYGETHYQEFYIQPKFVLNDQEYFHT